jgi:hypothetical protein
MKPESLRSRVAPLFAQGVTRSTRVAVEHELLAFDALTGGAVSVDRTRRAAVGAA